MTLVEQRPERMSRRERREAKRLMVQTATKAKDRDLLSSLVASAVSVRITDNYAGIRLGGTDWQNELWLHYDTCPEFHEGVNIGAHNLSRARLIGVELDPLTGEPGTQPTADADVQDVMSQLFGGSSGQSQALAQLYRHLDVCADAWVLATPRPDVDGQGWEILGTAEVTSGGTAGQIMVAQIDGIQRLLDVESELLIRIWQPHPRRRWDADSSSRALLPILREIAQLTAMTSATIKSRLASAGILWIPDDITLPKSVNEANDVTQVRSDSPGASGWLDLITEAMVTPIQDPDSAAAVVPIVATVRGDKIAQISYMEFGKTLDAMIQPLIELNIRRLAIGMSLPPEVLTGLGNVNHWTAWAITEEYAKAYLAPKLELIADALTTHYLRPALLARGRGDARTFAIYFDLDKLVPKQISVDNAQAAHDSGLLSDVEYMAALGFSSTQMADNTERARRLVETLVSRGNPVTIMELQSTIMALYPDVVIQSPPASAPMGAPGAAPIAPTTVTRASLPGAPPSSAPPTQPSSGADGTS